MSREREIEINSTIAEILGWQPVDDRTTGRPPGRSESEYEKMGNERIPSFSTDLNAMHEAERSLANPNAFRCNLCNIVARDEPKICAWENVGDYAISATAAQRAEAFLKVHGKWAT